MAGVVADKVIIELEAKLDRYNANVVRAQTTFERGMAQMRGSAQRTESVVTNSFRSMGAAFGTYLSARVLLAGAAGFLRYADAAKQLQATLKLATATSGDYATAQRDVLAIASATRSSLNETGRLYANIARNAKDLGITQAEVAHVTTTVTQAFLVSGAAQQEAAQGTRQLIQALQSGVLRGDEFNTVMEAAPRLARLLADSMGTPIGQLRAMAEEGELTSARLVAALSDRKFTEALDAEFKQLPVTFGQAMTLLDNAAQVTFSAFDQGGQFSTMLANFITQGADGFQDLAAAAEDLGIDIRSTMAGLYDVFQPMLEGALSVFGSIGDQAAGLQRAIADILGTIDAVENAVPRLANRIRQNGRNAGVGFLFGNDTPLPANRRDTFLGGVASSRRKLELDARERALSRLPGTGNAFQRFLNEPDKFNPFGVPNAPPRPVVLSPKDKKGGKGRKGPSAEQLAARAERERLQQEREDAAFAEELSRTNEAILQAKAAQVTALDAIAAFELQQIEAERARTNASYEADVVQKKLTRVQADQLIEANNQLAAEKSRTVQLREQERIRAEAVEIAQADRQNEIDLQQAAAALADTRTEQRDVALRILDLQYDLERAELENVLASQTATDAAKAIAQKRLDILGALQASERANIDRQHASPLERYRQELESLDINDQLEEVQVKGLKGLEDQLTSTIAKIFEMEGAFGQVANAMIADLIRLAVQLLVIQPLMASLGMGGAGAGGGLGGILGSIGGLFGGGNTGTGGMSAGIVGPRASGGHVMSGRLYRVNEGGGDVEGFQPAGSGKIIPLGRMRGAQGGGTTILQQFTLDARYGITTPELLRHVNNVATQQAATAGRTAFEASQRDLPRRFRSLQKLGN